MTAGPGRYLAAALALAGWMAIPGLHDADLDEAQQHAVGAAARNALAVVEAELPRRTGTGGPADDR